MDSIKDYDGIVTYEMIEAWEQENNPGNPIQNPTDPYGNCVEWDIQGSGNEEGVGSETKEDRMEAPTYDVKEQEEILESLQEKANLNVMWLISQKRKGIRANI